MLRRKFIQLVTAAGAGSIAAIRPLSASETKTVKYHVKGFTCITCAIGLETLLQQQKGVAWVKASYPEASVVIKYDPASVSEDTLKNAIADMGFTSEIEKQG
jgi:copper chaperone CopZ